MPIDLGAVAYAILVADADTPQELRRWNGTPVPIPEGVTLPTTKDAVTITIGGSLQTFWGYARTNSTSGNLEWVLGTPEDVDLLALDKLPGAQGWLVPQSRATFRAIGQGLRQRGITGAEMRPLMVQAWQAIVAERDAQILAAGGSLTGPVIS